MEIKRVAPERTDVITHVGDGGLKPAHMSRAPRERKQRSSDEDMVFGAIPRSTLGIISLVAMFLMALIFGVRELEMSVPVYLIILVFCTIMGVLLAGSPGFVSVLISALLLIVGAVTSLFPAVALGVAMLIGASLVIRGE